MILCPSESDLLMKRGLSDAPLSFHTIYEGTGFVPPFPINLPQASSTRLDHTQSITWHIPSDLRDRIPQAPRDSEPGPSTWRRAFASVKPY